MMASTSGEQAEVLAGGCVLTLVIKGQGWSPPGSGTLLENDLAGEGAEAKLPILITRALGGVLSPGNTGPQYLMPAGNNIQNNSITITEQIQAEDPFSLRQYFQ